MMNNINKTMFIPLYGKAYVSQKGIILHDEKAEEIWDKEGFELKGKSASKWLAYYMAMRSRVFDEWTIQKMNEYPDAVILHLGCGLDSRCIRVNHQRQLWMDVDFESVISERKKFYQEAENYQMISSDVTETAYLKNLKQKHAIVIIEGVSMYIQLDALKQLLKDLSDSFEQVSLLMDCYTVFAAKASKVKNPINDVGVTEVYGLDDPMILCHQTGFEFVDQHEMTPEFLINELQGIEKTVFKKLYAGKIADKMYRLYEYRK
ncbi:MAG: class I SAM-dependent methyltransferase [Erysipelotrichaceae bacterium]|nr:class I SAM-dependent methyltransferase [Erysipelotrichaceae bacterium]